MAKPLSKERAESILRGDDMAAARKAVKRLPADIDPSLVCPDMISALSNDWSFARTYDAVPAVVIREFLRQIGPIVADASRDDRYVALLISSVVSSDSNANSDSNDETLTKAWQLALQTILDLNLSYGWGSKKRRERFVSIAQQSILLAAIRIVAVACKRPKLDVLAVLVADGSDESIDALMPHFDAAEDDGPRLEQLGYLRVHANPSSEAVSALLDRLDERLAKRSAESPALDLAKHIGIDVGDLFWFSASVSSKELNRSNVSCYQAHVSVDSRGKDWFSVNVSRVGLGGRARSSFSSVRSLVDELELGDCEPSELPAWFAAAAKKLEISWRTSVRSNVRGGKRSRISEWLVSE